MAHPRRLKPTPAERRIFKQVVAEARKTGLRVPPIRWEVWEGLRVGRMEAHGCAIVGEGVIRIDREGLGLVGVDLLAHELAHVIVDQMVVTKAADHNRFWALAYGVLYQALVGK